MTYIKKIIYFIIASSLTVVVLLTVVLFIYAAFFFEPPALKMHTEKDQIIKNEETSDLSIGEIEPENKIEEIEPENKIEEIEPEKSNTPEEKDSGKVDVPKVEEAIQDSLFATVGNKAITQSDIINEIKIILILTGQSFTEDIREQLQAGAVQSSIQRNIKKIEIAKYDSLSFNPSDVDKELEKLANSVYMDLDTFENTFIANGIPFSTVVDQIKTELLWNSLIFDLYKDRLVVNPEEINEQLKSIQNKKETEEYLISEIIIKSVSQDKLESTIKEVKNKIIIEGFEKIAMNLSISETALHGGDLGWVSENVISEKFKSKIINTPIGNISEPIILPEGILFFKVRDKRKLKKFANLEDAKNQLVRAEKTKILKMYALSHFENLKKSISINYY